MFESREFYDTALALIITRLLFVSLQLALSISSYSDILITRETCQHRTSLSMCAISKGDVVSGFLQLLMPLKAQDIPGDLGMSF